MNIILNQTNNTHTLNTYLLSCHIIFEGNADGELLLQKKEGGAWVDVYTISSPFVNYNRSYLSYSIDGNEYFLYRFVLNGSTMGKLSINLINSTYKEIKNCFPIWAEESTDLTNNRFEWSFGNGNETPSGMGIVLPMACNLFALSLSLEGLASTSVEARRNDLTTGRVISTNNSKNNHINFKDDVITYNEGDVFNFKTIQGSRSSNAGVITAWFEVV